jgi:hypothetical protein
MDAETRNCWQCNSLLDLWLEIPGDPELLNDIKQHTEKCEIYQANRRICLEELRTKGRGDIARRLEKPS